MEEVSLKQRDCSGKISEKSRLMNLFENVSRKFGVVPALFIISLLLLLIIGIRWIKMPNLTCEIINPITAAAPTRNEKRLILTFNWMAENPETKLCLEDCGAIKSLRFENNGDEPIEYDAATLADFRTFLEQCAFGIGTCMVEPINKEKGDDYCVYKRKFREWTFCYRDIKGNYPSSGAFFLKTWMNPRNLWRLYHAIAN